MIAPTFLFVMLTEVSIQTRNHQDQSAKARLESQRCGSGS
jgi:hypothetical protein